MEKITQFQQAIIQVLEAWLPETSRTKDDIRNILITDKVNHHYQLLRMGWSGERHVFDPLIHFDIIDGKIWLQANNTDVDVAEDLVQAGIAREDIVLGLQPPFIRAFTAYGVA